LAIFLRPKEFRSNTYVVVVKNSTARDFIAKNRHYIEYSTSGYIETQMALSKFANIFLKSNIHEFYRRIKSNSAAPFASLGVINSPSLELENSEMDDKKEEAPSRRNPIELAGTALFRQDKMIGTLNERETLIASILKNDFRFCIIQVDDPNAPSHQIAIELKLARPPNIKVRFEEGLPKINILIDFYCAIKNIPSGVQYEKKEYQSQLEKVIVSYMLGETTSMLKKTQNMGIDIIGFGYNARGEFRTYPEFMAIVWDKLYKDAHIDVKITAKFKNSGLSRRTTPMSPTGFIDN
jgi:hypothetical protein